MPSLNQMRNREKRKKWSYQDDLNWIIQHLADTVTKPAVKDDAGNYNPPTREVAPWVLKEAKRELIPEATVAQLRYYIDNPDEQSRLFTALHNFKMKQEFSGQDEVADKPVSEERAHVITTRFLQKFAAQDWPAGGHIPGFAGHGPDYARELLSANTQGSEGERELPPVAAGGVPQKPGTPAGGKKPVQPKHPFLDQHLFVGPRPQADKLGKHDPVRDVPVSG